MLFITVISFGFTFIVHIILKEVTPTVARPTLKIMDIFKIFDFGEDEHFIFPMNIPVIRVKAEIIGF